MGTVSYSRSIATMAISLAVSTQYTNVTDTQTDTARQQKPRYAASLVCSRAEKKLRNVTKLHIRGETAISTWVNKARGYVAYVLYFVKDTYVRANVFHLNVRKQE